MREAAHNGRLSGWLPVVWLALVALGMAAAGYLLYAQQSQRGALEGEYSTLRTDARGCKALFLTLENMGYRPSRWRDDFSSLPSPGLLFLLAPAGSDKPGEVRPYEIQALDEWVKRGNILVVMGQGKNPLYKALGIFTSVRKAPAAVRPAQPGRLAAGVDEIALGGGRAFRFGKEPEDRGFFPTGEDEPDAPPIKTPNAAEWLPLFGTAAEPSVIALRRGRGQIIAVADALPASNVGLPRLNNLQFMANLASLAPGRRILFDEAHRAEIGRGFMTYARSRGLTAVLLYMALIFGMVVWRSGVRFGVPSPLAADPRPDSREYITAVAALYQGARMTRDALSANYDQFRRGALSWLRLGNQWNRERVAERFAARAGCPASEVLQVLEDIERLLVKPSISEAEAFAALTRLGALERRMHAPAVQEQPGEAASASP